MLQWFKKRGIICTYLAKNAANRVNVVKELTSGKYDIVHYCGHIWKVSIKSKRPVKEDSRGEYAFILHNKKPLRDS